MTAQVEVEAERERLHDLLDTLEVLKQFKPRYVSAFRRFVDEYERVPLTHTATDTRIDPHTRSSLRCLQAAQALEIDPEQTTALKRRTLCDIVTETLERSEGSLAQLGTPDIYAAANLLALARQCRSPQEERLWGDVVRYRDEEVEKSTANAYLLLFAQNALNERTPADKITQPAGVSQAALKLLQDQLVYHSARLVLEFDPAALAASAVLVSRAEPQHFVTQDLPTGGTDPIIRRAAAILLLGDGLTDAMRAPRPQNQSDDHDGVIHTVPFEDLLIVSHLPVQYLPLAMDAIQKSVREMREWFDQYPVNETGWTLQSDRAYPKPMSWITAIYSELLVRSERLLSYAYTEGYLRWTSQVEGKRVLRGTEETDDPPRNWAEVGETEQGAKQLIEAEILGGPEPAESPQGRSLLLFGPPGTSKTTLVHMIARQLRRSTHMRKAEDEPWPLLTVNPADVLGDGGYSQIVSNLRRLFREIRALSEVVVFFDEAENLVFGRALEGESREDRMITASMLPLLNDIGDEDILFVMATNYVREIDLAVRRRGRFALRVGVGGPDERTRERLIKVVLPRGVARWLAEMTSHLTIREVLQVCKELDRMRPARGRLSREKAEVVVRRAQGSAELSDEIRAAFREDLKAYHDSDLPLVS